MTTPYQRSVLVSAEPALIAPRFWPKVAIARSSDCWEWQAFRNGQGYGMLRVVGKMELAHRVSWHLHHGDLTDEIQVLHHCDNPPCVNPAHLFLGDNAMNVADKVRKHRSSFPNPWRQGERHHMAKLTAAQVAEIRAAPRERGMGRQLARQYGVCPATITNVIKGKVWRGDDAGDRRSSSPQAAPGTAPDGVGRSGN